MTITINTDLIAKIATVLILICAVIQPLVIGSVAYRKDHSPAFLDSAFLIRLYFIATFIVLPVSAIFLTTYIL